MWQERLRGRQKGKFSKGMGEGYCLKRREGPLNGEDLWRSITGSSNRDICCGKNKNEDENKNEINKINKKN